MIIFNSDSPRSAFSVIFTGRIVGAPVIRFEPVYEKDLGGI
jgi:hypothetical protein